MSRAPRSLRRRLGWGLTLILVGFWLAAMVVAGLVVRHEVDEVLDTHLAETAERILPLAFASSENGIEPARLPASDADDLQYGLLDPSGYTLLMSAGMDAGLLASAPKSGFAWTATHRIFVARDLSGASLMVAEPVGDRRDAAIETARALLVPLLLLVPLSVAAVLWMLSRGLAPVERLRSALATRDASDLSPLTLPGLPRELAVIGAAADALLGRLRRALEAERAFTADAAHELRTPLAASLAQVQRLLAELPSGDMAERTRQAERQLLRLAHLSGKLLDLARAEGGGVLATAPMDPVPILDAVIEELHRSGAGSRLVRRVPDEGAPPSRMDRDAFAILARNLIENALRHGDPEVPVHVELDRAGTLRVVNGGPVVPPDRLTQLTRRFARGGSRGEGSGLGLAIADAIARGAGARLELLSPARGRDDGFEATVSV